VDAVGQTRGVPRVQPLWNVTGNRIRALYELRYVSRSLDEAGLTWLRRSDEWPQRCNDAYNLAWNSSAFHIRIGFGCWHEESRDASSS
jgi:hypothetical protein